MPDTLTRVHDPLTRVGVSVGESSTSVVTFGAVDIRLTRVPRYRGKLFGDPAGKRRRTAQLHVVRSGALATRGEADGDAVDTFTPGQAFLIVGEKFPMVAHREAEVLSVVMPADRLGSGAPSDRPMRIDSALLAPTVEFITRAMLTVDASDFSRHHLQELVQRMIEGLIVDSNAAAAALPTKRSVFFEAMGVLTRRYAEPDLTADVIARAVSLSPRQLQRTFRARGTTIHRELRTLRVKRARRMLQDHRYDALTIDGVAQHVGFADRSSLARAMTAEGSPAPSQIRRGTANR